ncbi:hypothetical protein R1sor_011302 [Riccia sorocarpa]|uniref:Uncharacterized protein n=1 Tax=Riccia sorocarpa TaxID=122646 RepID=A0ABD3I4M5_9MARC
MRRVQLKVPELCAEGNYLSGDEHLGQNSVDTNVGIAAIAETVLESEPHDDDSAPWSHLGDLTDIAPQPGRRPPPSLREKLKWKAHRSHQIPFRPSDTVLDMQAMPVITTPAETGGPVHAYVTRSLFQDKPAVPHGSGGSNQGIINSSFASKFIGVEKDVFEVSMLAGSVDCDGEFGCCELMSATEDSILGLQKSLDSVTESEWSEDEDDRGEDGGSSSDSDWMEYAEEICTEDMPRLGLVQLTDDFHSDPFEWRFADENWPSHKTEFAYYTDFLREDPESVPAWFWDEQDSSNSNGCYLLIYFNVVSLSHLCE